MQIGWRRPQQAVKHRCARHEFGGVVPGCSRAAGGTKVVAGYGPGSPVWPDNGAVTYRLRGQRRQNCCTAAMHAWAATLGTVRLDGPLAHSTLILQLSVRSGPAVPGKWCCPAFRLRRSMAGTVLLWDRYHTWLTTGPAITASVEAGILRLLHQSVSSLLQFPRQAGSSVHCTHLPTDRGYHCC